MQQDNDHELRTADESVPCGGYTRLWHCFVNATAEERISGQSPSQHDKLPPCVGLGTGVDHGLAALRRVIANWLAAFPSTPLLTFGALPKGLTVRSRATSLVGRNVSLWGGTTGRLDAGF